MPRRTWGEIEEIARRLKRQLGIDDLWCPDLISVLDRLATVYPGLSVERLLDSELPDCEAQADCFEKKISIRESTYQACLRGDPRARMTVAHEIGHIALGHSGTRLRSVVLQVRRASTRVRDDEESEAIYFAGVFLAPTYLSRNCRTAEEMEQKFGVSPTAALTRFAQVIHLIEQGAPPAQRWAGRTKSQPSEKPRFGDGTPRLPTKIVSILRGVERRGGRVKTTLRDDDEE